MSVSNSYIRALITSFPIFAVFVAWSWHKEVELGFFGFFIAFVAGSILNLIVVLLVAMCLRTQGGSRAWWKFGLASLAGWFMLLFLAVYVLPNLLPSL